MSKKTQQPVTIKKNEQNPEPMEIIAKAIIDVSRGFKKINEGPLNQRVVVLLIKDLTGLSIADIERVLNAAAKLERVYIKQKP